MRAATPSVVLRPGTVADAPAVALLETIAFPDAPWPRSHYEEVIGDPWMMLELATCGDRLVGFILSHAAGEALDVHRVAVHPAWRRRGIGARLLRSACRAAARVGCRKVVLEMRADDPGAKAFYASLGMREIGRRVGYYNDGCDAIVLFGPCPLT